MAPDKDESTKSSSDDSYEPEPADSYEPKPVDNVESFDGLDEQDLVSDTSDDEATEEIGDEATTAPNTVESDTTKLSTIEPTEVAPDADVTGSEPAVSNASAITSSAEGKTSKRKKITIIAVAIVVVLGILAGLWFWYNSPNKVMADAYSQLLSKPITSAKGNFNLVNLSDSKLKLSGDFSSQQAEGGSVEFTTKINLSGSDMDLQIPLEVITAANGDLYVKVGQVKQLFNDILKNQHTSPAETKQMNSYFKGLISKVDDKWIKVSKEELKGLTKQAGSSQQPDVNCSQNIIKQFYASADQQKKIKQAFSDHTFLIVDKGLGSQTISGHASLGYAIRADEGQAKAFAKAVSGSQLVEGLKKCGLSSSEVDQDNDKSAQQPNVSMKAWVDRWNHQFTQFDLKVKDKTTDLSIKLEPSFDKASANIETPKDSTTVTELTESLQQAFVGLMDRPSIKD